MELIQRIARDNRLWGAERIRGELLKLGIRECLDHVIVLGEHRLFETLVEYAGYFDRARNHQGIGQLVPAGCSTAAAGGGAVIARPVLNGLHHDYRRAA